MITEEGFLISPCCGAMLSKSLTPFSADGQGCVPSLLFDLGPNYGGVMKIMAASFTRSQAQPAALSAPTPAAGQRRPTPPPEMPGHSRASLGQSLWGHCAFILGPGAQGFVCASKTVSPALWKFCNQVPLTSNVKFPGCSQSLCQIPRLGNLLWVLELF